MGVACPAGQERLRRELRGYFGELMTPAVRSALSGGDGDDGDGEAYRSVVRQLGRDGWLALGWPVQYGGRGGGPARPPPLRPRGAAGRGRGAPLPPHTTGAA